MSQSGSSAVTTTCLSPEKQRQQLTQKKKGNILPILDEESIGLLHFFSEKPFSKIASFRILISQKPTLQVRILIIVIC